MQSALIVHSRHTKAYAKKIAKKYNNVRFLQVVSPPSKETLKIKNNKDIVIGVGGGSVIDTAKIISKDKRAIVIPTTASGAAMTPYATVWGKTKTSISTNKPILKIDYTILKNLPSSVRQSTTFDALSHTIESFWSKNATLESKRYSKKAILLLSRFLKKNKRLIQKKDINELITAGSFAGQAIAITKTNVVHAASYPITIEYGIDHGTACGMVLPYFVEYMNFEGLPKLFNLNSTHEVVRLLKRSFIPPKIRNFKVNLIAGKIMKYAKVHDGPKKIDKKNLVMVLKKAIKQ